MTIKYRLKWRSKKGTKFLEIVILEFVELRFPLYYVQYGTVVFIGNIPQIELLRFCKFFAYIYVGSTFGLKLIINVEE